jgi:hypothetical protein
MIDRREHIPIDTLMVKHPSGDPAILLFTWDKVNGRRMAGLVDGPTEDGSFGSVVRDFVGREPTEVNPLPEAYNPAIGILAKKNYEQNKDKIRSLHETVILCGAGPSAERDVPMIEQNRQGVTVVTLSRTQRLIEGDYYVGLDPFPAHLDNLKGARVDKTIAVLATTVFPGVVALPWKAIGFFTHMIHDNHKDIPKYFAGETVSFTALQFCINTLKSKKVILVGMENSDDMTYYWHGKQIEAGSWWAARHGVEVWNCTGEGSVLNGVIHGKLSEVLNVH